MTLACRPLSSWSCCAVLSLVWYSAVQCSCVRSQRKARAALDFLWSQRNVDTQLLGSVLHVERANSWSRQDAGVGAGSDSYYEYLLKAFTLLGEPNLLERFDRVRLLPSGSPSASCSCSCSHQHSYSSSICSRTRSRSRSACIRLHYRSHTYESSYSRILIEAAVVLYEYTLSRMQVCVTYSSSVRYESHTLN